MSHFSYTLTIPANTAKTSPTRLFMPLDYGLITQVQIVIPDGQKASAHLRLMYRTRQLYPFNRPEWYQGDGTSIPFNDLFPLMSVPYELVAEGYNEDETYEHAFLIFINVQRPEELGFNRIPDVALAKLKALEGQKISID